MDQLREGINLRAYGQKNPLLEYKSEGFKMFQEMMGDMSAITIQRLFRTQLQGMEQSSNNKPILRNVETSHKDTTGMGLQGQAPKQVANQPNQVRTPLKVDQKMGRNEKITVQGPDGKKIEIKYKKLQNYLNKGFTQI
jgi:preprotein translocase subunit SecA